MTKKLTKIIDGFVRQTFGIDGKCTHQEFIAGDVDWENEDGEPINPPSNETYQPFEMLQPLPLQQVIEVRGGVIVIQSDGEGAVNLTSTDIKLECPYCGFTDCHFSCDQSKYDDEQENEAQTNARIEYNTAVDGVEAFLVALSAVGICMDTKLIAALDTALEAIDNNTQV